MVIVKKRCIRCRKPVREDGTCQNRNCVRYVPEKTEDPPAESTPATEEGTSNEN